MHVCVCVSSLLRWPSGGYKHELKGQGVWQGNIAEIEDVCDAFGYFSALTLAHVDVVYVTLALSWRL